MFSVLLYGICKLISRAICEISFVYFIKKIIWLLSDEDDFLRNMEGMGEIVIVKAIVDINSR